MPLEDVDVRIEISKLDESQRSQFVHARIRSFGLRKRVRSFYTFVELVSVLLNVQAFMYFGVTIIIVTHLQEVRKKLKLKEVKKT